MLKRGVTAKTLLYSFPNVDTAKKIEKRKSATQFLTGLPYGKPVITCLNSAFTQL